jgi:hypothetical protein
LQRHDVTEYHVNCKDIIGTITTKHSFSCANLMLMFISGDPKFAKFLKSC